VHPEDRQSLGPQIHRFRIDNAAAPSIEVNWSAHPFTYPDGTRVPVFRRGEWASEA